MSTSPLISISTIVFALCSIHLAYGSFQTAWYNTEALAPHNGVGANALDIALSDNGMIAVGMITVNAQFFKTAYVSFIDFATGQILHAAQLVRDLVTPSHVGSIAALPGGYFAVSIYPDAFIEIYHAIRGAPISNFTIPNRGPREVFVTTLSNGDFVVSGAEFTNGGTCWFQIYSGIANPQLVGSEISISSCWRPTVAAFPGGFVAAGSFTQLTKLAKFANDGSTIQGWTSVHTGCPMIETVNAVLLRDGLHFVIAGGANNFAEALACVFQLSDLTQVGGIVNKSIVNPYRYVRVVPYYLNQYIVVRRNVTATDAEPFHINGSSAGAVYEYPHGCVHSEARPQGILGAVATGFDEFVTADRCGAEKVVVTRTRLPAPPLPLSTNTSTKATPSPTLSSSDLHSATTSGTRTMTASLLQGATSSSPVVHSQGTGTSSVDVGTHGTHSETPSFSPSRQATCAKAHNSTRVPSPSPQVSPQPEATDSLTTVNFATSDGHTLGGRQALDRVIGRVPSVIALSTGTAASVVVAGMVNPAGATQVVRATLVIGIAKCAFSEDEDELEPELLELPLQIRVGDGELSRFGLYVGSLLLNTGCFVVVPQAVLIAVWRFCDPKTPWVHELQSKVVANAAYLGFAYFSPTSAKVLALVLFHPSTLLEKALSVGCFLLDLILTSALLRKVVALAASKDAKNNTRSIDYATFSPLYSAARCPPSLKYRLYFFEELLVMILFMFCDGIRPRQGNCGYVAAAFGAIALFHFIFLVSLRPYESLVELLCVLLSALILLGIATVAIVATFSTPSSMVMDVLGYFLLAESVVVFLQAVVLATYEYTVGQKRKLLQQHEKVDDKLGNAAPLLAVPQDAESLRPQVQPIAAQNPLTKSQCLSLE